MRRLKRIWRRIASQGIGHFLRNELRRWLFAVDADSFVVFKTSTAGRDSLAIPDRYELAEVCSVSDERYPPERLAEFHGRDQLNAGRSEAEIRNDVLTDFGNGDSVWMLVDKTSNDIAAWRWVGRQRTRYLSGIAKPIGLRQNEAIVYRSYVDRAHRGARLQIVLMEAVLRRLNAQGIEQVYGYVGIANTASLVNQFRYCDSCLPLTRVRLRVLGKELDVFPGLERSSWSQCGGRRSESSKR